MQKTEALWLPQVQRGRIFF